MKRALIVVDVQNDFLPDGALPVPGGDQVIPVINGLMSRFDFVAATQDWHPFDHGSFAAHYDEGRPGDMIELGGQPQILWPTHCVQEEEGAEFAPELDSARFDAVVRKGTDWEIDSYSGFFDNGHRKATELDDTLKAQGVTDVYVTGLATDYCVKFTALDAVELGYKTFLVEDACRGVNLQPGDVDKALAELREQGVQVTQSGEIDG